MPLIQDIVTSLTGPDNLITSSVLKSELISAAKEIKTEKRYLQHSPYTELPHLLDLETLDHENVLLAKALVQLKNVRPDYATASYLDSFNWTEVFDELKQLVAASHQPFNAKSWYIVAFRSQIPPTTVYEELGVLDKAAHAEANASGGFLK